MLGKHILGSLLHAAACHSHRRLTSSTELPGFFRLLSGAPCSNRQGWYLLLRLCHGQLVGRQCSRCDNTTGDSLLNTSFIVCTVGHMMLCRMVLRRSRDAQGCIWLHTFFVLCPFFFPFALAPCDTHHREGGRMGIVIFEWSTPSHSLKETGG